MKNHLSIKARRVGRSRSMSPSEIRRKLLQKLLHYAGYRSSVRRIAYALDTYSLRLFSDAYVERPEGGPTNLATKLLRQSAGGPFEPYSVSLVNRAAVQLVGAAETILEVGCGTGMFAAGAAKANQHAYVTASELDSDTLAWAREHRSATNINFCKLDLVDCCEDQFRLAVSLEVVEHIGNYPSFLRHMARVAPRAIISTPNKNRNAFSSIANTPEYGEHVREWTAGEFFWVLRCFWSDVQLYTLPDFQKQVAFYLRDPSYTPILRQCSVLEREEPLIAACTAPRRP